MSNPIINDLHALKQQLSDPAAWTKGASARDAQGNPVHETSGQAVSWCLGGAINCHPSRKDIFRSIVGVIGEGLIAPWNDHPNRMHDEVMQVLDRAIELAQNDEGEY